MRSADTDAPDSGEDSADETDLAPPVDPSSWPVVRRASGRFVVSCRLFALLALGYGVSIVLLALGDVTRSVWLWVAIVGGGLVHLAGVVGLWFAASRAPKRILPRPGPASGTESDRRRARRTLLAGGRLGAEQRRLVAVEVAAGARVPVVVAGAFALLGPVVTGTPNTDHPIPWLGPATAGVVLLILIGLAWQVRSVRRVHRDAQRAEALPSVEGSEVPFLP
ncbi:hypothetical protein EV383_4612 [Pseudonocardia sediminis]|uniref:Uncharacterized protein n=1 Tax=Pseudonocardia sediminis TaxID=1397368 RepID=A0A4Q7V087_PSEST|nr:hypothetical protein [Pseudonocardia sediminis]RZT87686.1 hypothetical protein EV383_4612 [Pseudonocardia sediminis]